MRIVFVLPGGGGGGGSYSVVQEATALAKFGVDVVIAVREADRIMLATHHPEVAERRVPTPGFMDAASLARAIDGADLAIATTAASAVLLDQALSQLPAPPRPAQYVQDYEPLFFAPGTPEWALSIKSFDVFPKGLRFAKSDWIASIVNANHAVEVKRVRPSIDHQVFYPALRQPLGGSPPTITAMIRPKTPRRGPARTARLLSRIAEEAAGRVRVVAFGSDTSALAALGVNLSPKVRNVGRLDRRQMAALHRAADLFLDLSDYQAFGRTAAEAMACGCLPVAPIFGAASEFIRHGVNGLLVDTRSDEAILDIVNAQLDAPVARWREMIRAAVVTSLDFSVETAAFSMLSLFEDHLAAEPATPPPAS